jgi:hypothetical protein
MSRVSHQSDHGVLVISLVEHCASYYHSVRKGRASRWGIIRYFAKFWRCGDIAELYPPQDVQYVEFRYRIKEGVKSEIWRCVAATVEAKVAVKRCLNLPGQSDAFKLGCECRAVHRKLSSQY